MRDAVTLVAALLFMGLSGCGGSGGGFVDADPRVFFLNASTDAGASDFLVDDTAKATGLDFMGKSADWVQLGLQDNTSTGGYDISVAPTGGGLDYDRVAQQLTANSSTVLALVGEKTPADGDSAKILRLVSFTVNRVQPNTGKARLVVFNAFNRSTGQGTPAIILKNPGENPQFQSGAVNPGESATMEVDAGTFTWEAKRSDAEAVYATATSTVASGKLYLVVVAGVEGNADAAKQPKITFVPLSVKTD
ncbi:MAG: DUF4397 domain-containing protein [Fimbriimonadaceae bacterium]|nr:DUF4397 domain-containing protein [Fimbriimonadaceae bacterium]